MTNIVIYVVIGFAVGAFVGMVVDKITTGNCKIIKKFKKSGEKDLYTYIMKNEGDKSESKDNEDKNKE